MKTQFRIKSQNKKETSEALDELLSVTSQLLIFGYGYVNHSDIIEAYVEGLITWLLRDRARTLEIYVGILPDPRRKDKVAALEEKKKEILTNFAKILPTKLFETGVTDRISVYAVEGFHCKFALACNVDDENCLTPLAGIFGSSNLSYSALHDPSRFELDFSIGPNNPLLSDFSSAVIEIINDTADATAFEVGGQIKDRTFFDQVLKQAYEDAAIDEAHAAQEYRNQGHTEEDRRALVESDKAQGIYRSSAVDD